MNNLRIETKGAIRILTLNRPEKRNALDTALSRALLEALRAADADETVRCVVLTGAGPAFCAGADLAEFKGLRDPQAAETRAELTMQLHLAFSKLVTPVVTAKHGIVPAIVMANLVRQVGRKAAFELVALGEPIDAKRAAALGMVNRVVTKARLMPTALALARQLAGVNKPAMAQTKTLFHEVADLPLERALERGRDANKRMRNFAKLDDGT